MAVERFGLRADPPASWRVAIDRRPADTAALVPDPSGAWVAAEDVTHPVLHACTRPLPAQRGDFGSGVVDLLGSEDVFLALVEYGSEVADQGLFAAQGFPRLAPSQFAPNRLQRPMPGRSAAQHFFSVGGRAFCLFTVLGGHSRRMASVPKAVQVVRSLRVTDRATMIRKGGLP